jgi:hypothetical protein
VGVAQADKSMLSDSTTANSGYSKRFIFFSLNV